MWVKDLKIGMRLGLGFGVILLIIAITIGINEAYLKNVLENTRIVENESLPSAMIIDDMKYQTLQVLEIMLYASLTRNAEGFKEAEKIVEKFHNNLSVCREIYIKKNDQACLQRIEKMNELFRAYYERGRDMAFVYFTEGVEEGNKLVAGFESIAFDMNNLINEIHKRQIETVSTGINVIVSSATRLRQVSFVINALAIVLCLLIAVVMTRGITRPTRQVVAGLKDIAQGEADLTRRLDVGRDDEIGELAGWFNTFIDRLRNIVSEFKENASALNASSSELSELATRITDESHTISRKSETVSSAGENMSMGFTSVASSMEQASSNMNTVAASIEEITATINEIAANSEKASSISSKAVSQSKEAAGKMNNLGDAAREIGKVTEVITEISEQTNLLALNATIEAARAGEAGKGFTVVANEIKELARQTSEATSQIKKQIENIQASIAGSINEIVQIAQINGDVNDIVSSIAAAVEEQSTTTREIASNVAYASEGITDVNRNVASSSSRAAEIAREISAVNQANGMMSDNSVLVKNGADALRQIARKLHGLVENFKV